MPELFDVYTRNRVKTGRTAVRGSQMAQEEYHVVVHVWVQNTRGEWLISKRTPNKHRPNMWECTGGSVIAGEDSLSAALRETREELGVTLRPEAGRLWCSYPQQRPDSSQLVDVWLFRHDCPIESIVLQADETSDAMWATSDKILEMLRAGVFVDGDVFPYLGALFSACPKYVENASDADIPDWLALAAEVADNFPGLELHAYAATLRENISRGTALCVRQDGQLAGVLLYSPKRRFLSCMAVRPEYRRSGIASALVAELLRRLPDGDIEVTTFREGDELGNAPRRLYRKFGFEPEELLIEFDYPVQRFVLHRKESAAKITVTMNETDIPDERLLFAVIAAKYRGKWIFCRQKLRETWEIPGGHREPGEAIDGTASRELYEETGALEFNLTPVTVYSVTAGGKTTSGKLYLAEVATLGPLPPEWEIGELCFSDTLPEKLTYPDIQPILFKTVRDL